jgi:hypothetical protein
MLIPKRVNEINKSEIVHILLRQVLFDTKIEMPTHAQKIAI